MKTFDIIVCHDQNRGIGKDNCLPWKLSKDMTHFKKLTSTPQTQGKLNVIIMGRKTWESLPKKPLVNRHNVIISKQLSFSKPYCQSFHLLDKALEDCLSNPKYDRVFIIGGESLYQQTLFHKKCNRIYVTKILKTFNCDRFFPTYENKVKLLENLKQEKENDLIIEKKIYQNLNQSCFLNPL